MIHAVVTLSDLEHRTDHCSLQDTHSKHWTMRTIYMQYSIMQYIPAI